MLFSELLSHLPFPLPPPPSSPHSTTQPAVQEVERLKRDNTQLQAQFLLKGQLLMAQSVQSLADEMEDASRDEVRKLICFIVLYIHVC